MIVAKSPGHDCSATDYPATRGSAFARDLALVGGTDMPAHRRGPAEQAICFGTFHLLPRQRLLVEGGHPVHLGSRALDILVALVERAGHVVAKHELMARIWPDSSVEENNLKVHVAALRRTLGEGLPGRRYVVNVHGRGYVFVAPVKRGAAQSFNLCAAAKTGRDLSYAGGWRESA